MPQDARSLASPSPSPAPSSPTTRHISARDVRDLALAVIEGAVAAEALAKELKRSPDRSRHFQDIAERLRAIVARTSIRSALADESSSGHVVVSPSIVSPSVTHVVPAAPTPVSAAPPAPVVPPPLPKAASGEAPAPSGPQPVVGEDGRTSGERAVPPLTADELVSLVVRASHGDEIATRLARLEYAVTGASQFASDVARKAVAEAAAQATAAANAGERVAVSTPAEALALASRLTERLQVGMTLTVRVETALPGIRHG